MFKKPKKPKKAKAVEKPILTPMDADLLADGWYVVPTPKPSSYPYFDQTQGWKTLEIKTGDWSFGHSVYNAYADALHAIRQEVAKRGVERIERKEIEEALVYNEQCGVRGLAPIGDNWLRD